MVHSRDCNQSFERWAPSDWRCACYQYTAPSFFELIRITGVTFVQVSSSVIDCNVFVISTESRSCESMHELRDAHTGMFSHSDSTFICQFLETYQLFSFHSLIRYLHKTDQKFATCNNLRGGIISKLQTVREGIHEWMECELPESIIWPGIWSWPVVFVLGLSILIIQMSSNPVKFRFRFCIICVW